MKTIIILLKVEMESVFAKTKRTPLNTISWKNEHLSFELLKLTMKKILSILANAQTLSSHSAEQYIQTDHLCNRCVRVHHDALESGRPFVSGT